MLQAYIRVSAIMTKWMFSSIFCIVAPFINKVLALASGLSGIAAVITLFIFWPHPFEARPFWILAGFSVSCMALLLFMEAIEFVVEMNQIKFMMQPYEGRLIDRIRNTLLGLAWFLALSIGSFYVFHLENGLEGGAIGFALFLGLGNLIGFGLMMKDGGAQVSDMLGDLFDRMKASLTLKRKPASAELGNVVQMRFTKRG
ncbi:MAG: hypothetical protein ACYCZR_01565 [Burkholderiales bacterium]